MPYPEDAGVAKWVRDFAEPNNIISKAKGVVTDPRPLLKPSEEWLRTRKEKVRVTVTGVRKNLDNPEPPPPPPPMVNAPKIKVLGKRT
ncbi:MAG: hypothetical protein IPM82_07470 [Saprospiraceae bacterium]|nr:hypothetical protein [Saprospiraceae bacterium]